jgi:hypothetical protein
MKKFKILDGGRVELPRELEERWSTRFVTLEDHDEFIILRPAPDEASVPPDLEEHWPDEAMPPSTRRGSTGAGW